MQGWPKEENAGVCMVGPFPKGASLNVLSMQVQKGIQFEHDLILISLLRVEAILRTFFVGLIVS